LVFVCLAVVRPDVIGERVIVPPLRRVRHDGSPLPRLWHRLSSTVAK
jgi:hypothetical protein